MEQPMTEHEFEEMRTLIKRYAESEMDQWAMWRTTTRSGPIYVSITRVPEAGAADDAYDPF